MTVYKLDPNKTPDDYRQMAKDCYRRKEESWERSDTDGFLSQWASDCTARVYETLASLAENGGVADFDRLADLETGEIVNAKVIDGKFGPCWMLLDETGKATGQFVPYHPARESTLAKRGYKEITVERKAVVVLAGNDYNLWPRFIEAKDQD